MLNTKCWIIQKYQIIQRAKCYLVNTVTIFSNWDAAKMGNKPQTTNASTSKGSKKPQTRNISKNQRDVQVFIVFSLSRMFLKVTSEPAQGTRYKVQGAQCTKVYQGVQGTRYKVQGVQPAQCTKVHKRLPVQCAVHIVPQCTYAESRNNMLCNVIWTMCCLQCYLQYYMQCYLNSAVCREILKTRILFPCVIFVPMISVPDIKDNGSLISDNCHHLLGKVHQQEDKYTKGRVKKNRDKAWPLFPSFFNPSLSNT